jgi:hypothetical protein
MEAAVVEGLEVGRFGSPFAALPFGPAEATAPLCGEALLGNALLVWALAGGQGEAALALQRRLDGLPAGGAVRSGWTAWFLPSWEAGSGGASRLAPVARTLARLKVVSLGPGPGGVMVRPGALREMSVGTPVFQAAASQAGDGVWGQWNPLAGKGCLHLEFGAEEEAGRWSPASGGGILSWRREGTRLRLEVKRGEKWAVQRS